MPRYHCNPAYVYFACFRSLLRLRSARGSITDQRERERERAEGKINYTSIRRQHTTPLLFYFLSTQPTRAYQSVWFIYTKENITRHTSACVAFTHVYV